MLIGNSIVEVAIGLVEVATIRRKSIAWRTAKKEIRRLIAKAVQRKQFGDTEQKLTKSLTPFFARQIRSAQKELGELKGTGLTEKQSDASVNLAKMIFNPREWDRELVDRSLPVVAEAMVEGAVSTLAMVGVELRKSASNGRKPKGYNIPIDSPIGRVVAAGGRFGGVKASTASEWLEQEGIGPPLPMEFDTPHGPVRIGVATEYPQWLQREISSGLRETFEQDYWSKPPGSINDTTLQNLEMYLDKGLRDGWSISKMASNMTSIMGPEYYKGRSTNIARTESGNALNAGRDASIRGVQEAVGPEAAPQVGKGWLSVLGNTTRDTHADADGQLADADGNFNLAGYTIPWPGYFSLPPGERCNCQCTITMELGVGMPEDQLQAALGELE